MTEHTMKVERMKRGINQKEFAEMLGISQGYLSSIESGLMPSQSHILDRARKELAEFDEKSATAVKEAFDKAQEKAKQTNESSPLQRAIESVNEIVKGVGKDAPTVVNEKGGKQSKVLYRFDLLDPKAMFEMTKVLEEGAQKYGEWNWRNIDVNDHLNHMIIHAFAYLAGDRSDEHLSHIMCRAMFAQAVELQQEEGKE